MGRLPRKGLNQKELAARIGYTKQAVNQQIDELVKAGILIRTISKTGKRARIISDIDKIKLKIEQNHLDIVGQDALDQLTQTVDKFTDSE